MRWGIERECDCECEHARAMCCELINVIVVLPHDYSVIFSSPSLALSPLRLILFQFDTAVIVAAADVVAITIITVFSLCACISLFFSFLHLSWWFFSAKFSITVAVCIVINEGGNFRKTICNELFPWPRIHVHHFWCWAYLRHKLYFIHLALESKMRFDFSFFIIKFYV